MPGMLVPTLAALLAGAAWAQAPASDLNLCYYWATSDHPDLAKELLEGAFASVTKVASQYNDEDCDVNVRFNQKPNTSFYADIYSLETHTSMLTIDGHGRMPETAAAVVAALSPGAASYERAAAERAKRLKRERRRAEPAGASSAARPAPKSALPHSAVDRPRYPKRPENPDDFAVVVGIESYSDIPEASFAARDAEAVKNHLIALGFPGRNVVHLAGSKAGYSALKKYIEVWLPRNVKPSSRVFFYFSGHGAPDASTGRAYLLPWDGDPNFLEATAYPVKTLYEKLGALKAGSVIVALDACFSGAGGRSVMAKGARPLVTKLEAAAVPGGLTVFAAAAGGQITAAAQEQGHGLFTYFFLEGLSGGARDAKGAVTAAGLQKYLEPRVADAARRQNREQTPVLQGVRDAVLTRF